MEVETQLVLGSDDKMIPPDAQRAMSKRAESNTVEVKGSHAVYVSQPEAIEILSLEQRRASRKVAKHRPLEACQNSGGQPLSRPFSHFEFSSVSDFWGLIKHLF